MEPAHLHFGGGAAETILDPLMRKSLLRLFNTEVGLRRSSVILLLILVGVGLSAALHSFVKPFWSDEIFTVMVCRLPNASQIWKALDDVVDTNPPIYHLVCRLTRQIAWDDHLGYRLPSIIGLLGTIFFLYHILSRRVDHLSALVGATFVLCTQLAVYASEARPYALMVGCISGAIFAWQRIDDSRLYYLLFGFTLAAAASVHYYAILVWPAFVIAETTVWLFGRRFRIGAWAALFVGATPLLFFAELILRLRQYGQNFWAPASFSQVLWADSWLFNFGSNLLGGAVATWGLTIMVAVTAMFVYFNFGKRAISGSSGRRKISDIVLPLEECVLVLMLLLLPLIEVAAAKVSHGGMMYRYMMPTVLGGALAVGYLASRVPRAVNGLLLMVICMNYGLSSAGDVKKLLTGSLLEPRVAAAEEVKAILTELHGSDLPIVISSGLQYLPLAYYTPADSSRRLYALTDVRSALAFTGTDSADLALLALRRYYPLQIEEYNDFAARHREFLLVSENKGRFDWWPARLSHDGHTLRLLTQVGDSQVFKVTLRP
jgi:hypothetical protein